MSRKEALPGMPWKESPPSGMPWKEPASAAAPFRISPEDISRKSRGSPEIRSRSRWSRASSARTIQDVGEARLTMEFLRSSSMAPRRSASS